VARPRPSHASQLELLSDELGKQAETAQPPGWFLLFPPISSLYYGWVLVVALGITTIISYGTTQYLFGVLVVPLSETFHWSRASISGANALSVLIAGVLGVPVGYVLDRWGARLLMTGGSLLAGGSLIGLAFMQQIWQLYLLWALGIGMAMALIFYPVSFTVITTWFERKRTRALTLLTLLGALASPLFIPVTGWLLPVLGWRTIVLICGMLHVGLSVPLHASLLRRAPEDLGLAPDGGCPASTEQRERTLLSGLSVLQATKSLAFWSLTFAFALSMLGNFAILTHQIAHLIHLRYDPVLAAALAGGLGLASFPGRVLISLLSRRITPQHLLIGAHLLQALGVILLILAPSVLWLILYVLFFGAASGAISPLKAAVMADHFGRRAYGAITALQGTVIAVCAAGGPVAAGWLYDLFGRYDVAFGLCALSFVVAALLVLLAPPSKQLPLSRQP
jgi:MFS family permease